MSSGLPTLHAFAGASVRRVVDPSRAVVREHAHDWPTLSLYVLGGYRNVTERGELDIAGPSMLFYGAGVAHRNVVGDTGFEQIEIEFDPAWLGSPEVPRESVLVRVGGGTGALARVIARACEAALPEVQLRDSILRLFATARRQPAAPSATWAAEVSDRLRADPGRLIGSVASELGRSPAWIGPAYRRSMGEGLQEAAARFRVEHAARLLRESEESLAAIAAASGFCDQSHMNRCFRRVLGRLPTAVRQDREVFLRQALKGAGA